MRTLLALLMLSAAAQAQTIVTTSPGGMCFANGVWFPSRNGVCFSEDAVLSPCLTQEACKLPTVSGNVLTSTISNYTPKCDEGWTLIHAGRPMCARELREPK